MTINLDLILERTYSAISAEKGRRVKRKCPKRKKGNDEKKDGTSKSANIMEEDFDNVIGDILFVSFGSNHLIDF